MRRLLGWLSLLAGCLAILACLYVFIRRNERETVPVLTYHYFKSPEFPDPVIPVGLAEYYIVTRQEFERQLDLLTSRGYHTVTFTDLCRAKHLRDLPPKPVVITVDHEALDRLQIATPALASRHMTASFFVVTDWIGRPGNCTAADLRAMVAAGMDVESHTKAHPSMNEVSRGRQRDELARSKSALEAMLGRPVWTWTPPGGKWNQVSVEESKRAGYLGFRNTDPGLGHVGDYVWPGITVPGGLTDREFLRLLNPGSVRGLVVVRRIERLASAALGNFAYAAIRRALLGSGLGRVIQSPLSSEVVRITLLILLGLFAGSWAAVRAVPRNSAWKSRARDARLWLLLLSTVVSLRLATFEMLRPSWNLSSPHALAGSSEAYDDIARSLLAGRGFSQSPSLASPTVVSGPAWPAVLALVLSLRTDVLGTEFLLSLLNALTAVFLYRIARRLWSKQVAWVAVLAFAACPLLVHTSVLLIPANLSVLIATAMIDGILGFRVRPGMARGVWLGLLGAALSLTHEACLPILPCLLFVGAGWMEPATRRRYGGGAWLAVAVMVLAVLPWTVRNLRVTGTLVPVHVYAGRQYWQGEAWSRTDWTADGRTLAAAESLEVAGALGHAPARGNPGARVEAEEDHALVAAAWRDACARPGHLPAKALANSLNMWFRSSQPAQSAVLLLFQAPLLLLWLAGLGGLALRRRFGPELVLILVFPLLLTLLRAPLLGRARYCMAAEPMVILPAAWCLVACIQGAAAVVRRRGAPVPGFRPGR